MSADSSDTVFVSFVCPACNQEIEAPVEMSGKESECPACAAPILVPAASEPGTLWAASPTPDNATSQAQRDAMKGRTIRIELPENW